MKHLLFSSLFAFSLQCVAQITGLSVETVVEHDGISIPELAGHTTYRVYADVASSTDFISAVYGDSETPLMLGTDGTFFQDAIAGNFAQQVVPFLFQTFPSLEYDSWMTIGISNSEEGSSVQNTPSALADSFSAFNEGGGFVIDSPYGGSWFNLLQCLTTVEECAMEDLAFGGADNRVLLAQLTSTGDVYGVFNIQVFPAGDQDEEIKQTLTFSSNNTEVFGCTNPDAVGNEEGEGMYDPNATIDDFSCVLGCTVDLQLTEVTPPTCHGDADASFAVEATGAQGADYFYLDSIGSQQGLNFGSFGNLPAGTYMAFVEDAAGCRDSLEVVVPVTEPIEVAIELTSPVSCYGEEDAELSVVYAGGGTGEFTYFLSIDPENTTTETTWTGLAPGQTVSVWATDSNGCIQLSSNSVYITSPTPVTVDLAPYGIVDATCADVEDGSIFLVGLGGNAPATIEYSVDGVNFGTSPVTVYSGTYTVIAQDVYGCQATLSDSVVVGPPAIELNATASAEQCPGSNDGEVSWDPVGGEGAYTYVFNGEATTATSASNLAPGEYDVVVTDGNNCSSTATVTVEAGVSGNPGCGGCTNPEACNYHPDVLFDDGSCLFLDECGVCGGEGIPEGDCDCEGNQLDIVGICGGGCTTDFNSNGVCDDQETLGCTYTLATNFNDEATTDDGSCVFPCVGDVNQNIFDWDANGNIGIADFLQMLSVFGDVDVDGDGVWDSQDDCVDLEACNYDSDPTEACQYLDILGVCGGGCEADEDDDGICDDVDTCIGIVDECGVCNGPGATEIIVEDIIFTYDSIFLPVDNEWFVYASSVDTIFGFECPGPFAECDNYIENPSSLGVYSLTIEPSEAIYPSLGTVYRFYVNALNDSDKFSAFFGNDNDSLIFETPDGIFNSPMNPSWNASGVNPLLFPFFPDLQNDSYATIGLVGPAETSGVAGAENPSLVHDENLSPNVEEYFTLPYETSLNVTSLLGASIYVLNTAANALPTDGRWLIAQITTTGSISGQIPVQIFPLGVGADQVQKTFVFDGCGTFY